MVFRQMLLLSILGSVFVMTLALLYMMTSTIASRADIGLNNKIAVMCNLPAISPMMILRLMSLTAIDRNLPNR